MIFEAPTAADVEMVLRNCGPFRRAGTAHLSTNDAATKWMESLLTEEGGAEAITLAIMTVWYAMTCHGEQDRREKMAQAEDVRALAHAQEAQRARSLSAYLEGAAAVLDDEYASNQFLEAAGHLDMYAATLEAQASGEKVSGQMTVEEFERRAREIEPEHFVTCQWDSVNGWAIYTDSVDIHEVTAEACLATLREAVEGEG